MRSKRRSATTSASRSIEIRHFFAMVAEGYKGEGYLGCLLGGLGQELSGISPIFRKKVEACFNVIARRFEKALKVAEARGQLCDGTAPRELAELLVNCWEGAALRSRMRQSPLPLGQMLDFYFTAVGLDPLISAALSRLFLRP